MKANNFKPKREKKQKEEFCLKCVLNEMILQSNIRSFFEVKMTLADIVCSGTKLSFLIFIKVIFCINAFLND